MIITRETDYAVRILRCLADFQLKTIREISEDQIVPRQFAYKISKKLERAGFIEIIRGATGGCRMKADLHDVTLMDLINVMDRDNMISSCLNPSVHCPYRDKNHGCCVHDTLCQVQQHIINLFTGLNMYDVIFKECDYTEHKK
ncbi:MAG: Rrf2 family transcriptional regulator [Megasphaera sp.]|nr:Rrf2 family transcriptional regulator [Megasphaera sp.]MCH4187751.1 Rrf2 family transcriptional regulator [Megasphaera sp.]MCH4217804.1 Rrf2 family transcriptional regulator [Megasphaera sp.]